MRTSGVLMPISSLPSPYGIGTMGKDAKKFVDFLEKGGQKYWQILPICPTSYGDSPYQSFSSFAGNPYFIDLDYLQAMAIRRISHFQALQVIHILSILTICVRISSLPKRNVSRMIGERVPKK